MSPTYGYKCSKCGEVFEVRTVVEGRYLVRCPKCGYLAELMVVQPFNFRMGMKWPADRKEHFAREFENRRCERPKAYG